MAPAGNASLVFILSDMRSGSTLLDQLLGAHPEVLSVGELHWLNAYATQDRGLYDPDHDLVCTCGLPVVQCTFWSQVASRLGRPLGSLQLQPAFEPLARQLRDRFPGLFAIRAFRDLLFGKREVRDNVALADCLLELSGCRSLVDSSKSEFRFRAVYDARPSQARALILTRDYRAVVHSKMKRGHSMQSAAIGWRNKMRRIAAFTDGLPADRVYRLTYEGLCGDPVGELGRLCRFLDLGFSATMLERPTEGVHHIGGSPSKFDPSRGQIMLDSAYQSAFTTQQLALLARLVGDVAKKWGY
jgi:hypothetical protein